MTADRLYAPGSLQVETYDWIPAHAGRRDRPFYEALARATPGRILYVGAGTGRLVCHLARSGHPVCAVEPAAGMRARLREALHRESSQVQQRVHVEPTSAQTFESVGPFSCCFLPFRVLQHLFDLDAQLSALLRIHRTLAAGGVLAFDLMFPDPQYLSRPGTVAFERPFQLADGRVVQRMGTLLSYDPVSQRARFRVAYDVDGVRAGQETFTLRMFHITETEHLLARAGFEVELVAGGFEGEAPGETEDLVVVARKAPAPVTAV